MLPYSPSDINSCYSYVSPAGSRKRMEEEASSPLLFVLSDSFLSVEARITNVFEDYLEDV